MHRMRLPIERWLAIGAVATMAASGQAAPPTPGLESVQIVAEAMCCKGCARKVSGQLYAARGVRDVGVEMSTHTITVSLPSPNATTLGQLWEAVEKGEGGPTKLVTAEATYSLVRPDAEGGSLPEPSTQPPTIVIDNLHCKGCAKKIAAQLYAVKGVTKVSVDLERETLYVESRPNMTPSPWRLIGAVRNARERPLAVSGPYGTLAIEWATKPAPKHHQQAQQTNSGGIQR